MFLLNLHGKEPINEQIQSQIIQFINLNVLKPNEKLPSVRELANELGINPNTFMKAYQNLENEGYIYMLSKKGAFVSEKSYDNQNEILNELKTVFMKAKDMGVKYDEIVDTVNEVFKC